MGALRVIHTSDLHNRLDQARAEALARLRAETGALLLDSGDAVGAANVTVRRAEPVIDWMNLAGYDAMCVGNREYYFRRRGMLHKTAAARFAVLSANIVPRDEGRDLGHIRPWQVFETDAGRVGVFGLSRVMIRPGSWAEVFSDLRFAPWRDAAARALEQLRSRSDWLVALSHLGGRRDRELVQRHPELDLVLSGHGHATSHEVLGGNRTMLSRAGALARAAAVIEIERTADGPRRLDWRLMDLP